MNICLNNRRRSFWVIYRFGADERLFEVENRRKVFFVEEKRERVTALLNVSHQTSTLSENQYAARNDLDHTAYLRNPGHLWRFGFDDWTFRWNGSEERGRISFTCQTCETVKNIYLLISSHLTLLFFLLLFLDGILSKSPSKESRSLSVSLSGSSSAFSSSSTMPSSTSFSLFPFSEIVFEKIKKNCLEMGEMHECTRRHTILRFWSWFAVFLLLLFFIWIRTSFRHWD